MWRTLVSFTVSGKNLQPICLQQMSGHFRLQTDKAYNLFCLEDTCLGSLLYCSMYFSVSLYTVGLLDLSMDVFSVLQILSFHS